MEQASISVIVPIYNVEAYLDRCVDSIRTQTYDNLEVILVDDGSVDDSGVLADSMILADERIITVHKRNGGQAEARNYGIALSSGGLTGFVDSDDYVSKVMYEQLITLLQSYQADLSECRMVKFSYGEKPVFAQTGETMVCEGVEKIRCLIDETAFTPTVPNLLVKSFIARSVLFDVGKINEDVLWPYRVLVKCKKAASTTQTLYAYYQREGSTMNSAFSVKRFDGLDALQTRAQEIRKDCPDLYPRAERAYAGACMYQYQYLARQKKCEEYKRYMKILHYRFCTSDRKAFLPSTDFIYKIWYTMFAIMPRITSWIRNTMKIGL